MKRFGFAMLLLSMFMFSVGCDNTSTPGPDDNGSSTTTDSQEGDHDEEHGDHDHEHGDHDHDHGDHDHGAAAGGTGDALNVAAVAYCGSCGQAKGTEACCAEGAEKCESCGLAQGAPLCCKLEGDFTGKTLCGKCGEVKGTDVCCAKDAEKCEKCNLHVGSPLCCKLAAKEEATE